MFILLAFLALLADIGGGLIPLHPRLRQISTRYVLAFASGTVIAAAFFELMPEANIESNWWLLGLGFFVMYIIDKGLALHQCGEHECEITGVSWVTVLGMAADNIIDGAGIAVAYLTSPALGLVVTFAVIAHEIPQGMTTTLVMKEQGYPLKRIFTVLAVAGIAYPVGAGIGSFIPAAAHEGAVAFVTGVFIYTGAAALMTEAHRRFNVQVMMFLLLGSVIALLLKFVET